VISIVFALPNHLGLPAKVLSCGQNASEGYTKSHYRSGENDNLSECYKSINNVCRMVLVLSFYSVNDLIFITATGLEALRA
jgi:hypothetical protein